MVSKSAPSRRLTELRQEIAVLRDGLRTAEAEYTSAVRERDEIIRRVRLSELDRDFARADDAYREAKLMKNAIRNAIVRAEDRIKKLERN